MLFRVLFPGKYVKGHKTTNRFQDVNKKQLYRGYIPTFGINMYLKC